MSVPYVQSPQAWKVAFGLQCAQYDYSSAACVLYINFYICDYHMTQISLNYVTRLGDHGFEFD